MKRVKKEEMEKGRKLCKDTNTNKHYLYSAEINT